MPSPPGPHALTPVSSIYRPSVPPPRHRVLCIHGWMDNVGSFDTLLPLLPDENHYVSVDLPGHGANTPGTRGYFCKALTWVGQRVQARPSTGPTTRTLSSSTSATSTTS